MKEKRLRILTYFVPSHAVSKTGMRMPTGIKYK